MKEVIRGEGDIIFGVVTSKGVVAHGTHAHPRRASGCVVSWVGHFMCRPSWEPARENVFW